MTTKEAGRASLLRDGNMLVIFLITLIAVMGVSSIAPVLPAVAAHYRITPQHASWLIAAFTLPGTFFTPFAGLLGDRYGRKRVLVPSLALFAVAGTACAFAGSLEQLIVLRALQGLGAAALGALNLAIIADLYSGHRRVTAMGYNNGVISSAAAAFPLLGGVLAIADWRLPFLLPLVAVPVALLVIYALEVPRAPRWGSLGSYLMAMWGTIRNRRVAALFFSGFVAFTCVYGALLTYLPFLLEERFGMTALESGLFIGGNAVASAFGSVSLGRLATRFSRRSILVVSFLLMAVPTGLTPFVPSLIALFALNIVWGLGIGAGIGLIMGLLADLAPVEQRGAVLALNATMFRLGQTGGPALMAAVLAVAGIDAAFVFEAAIVLVAVAVLAAAVKH